MTTHAIDIHTHAEEPCGCHADDGYDDFQAGMTAYFNGIGHTRLPLAVTAVVAISNVFLNEFFIFGLGLGISGAAWAGP